MSCSIVRATEILSLLVEETARIVVPLAKKAGSESDGGWFVFGRPPEPMCVPCPIVGFAFGNTGRWDHIKIVVTNAHDKLRLLANDPFRNSSVQIHLDPHGNPWRSDTEGERVEAGAIYCGYPGIEDMIFSCSAFPGFPLFDEMLCVIVGRKLGLVSNERMEKILEISSNQPAKLYFSHLRTAKR